MGIPSIRSRVAALAAALVVPAAPAIPQGDRQGQGLSREQMWRAPTAEDWKKPVLIHWQRTWEDALAVARATNRPILICVNMDGEIASEHYAGIRYRQPEVARLYEPYVCVIASVYRHNPRDYDEEGRRIPCPRFGTVTCGEHIAIEPILYEKFFDGKRIAPRHIMVEVDGSKVYDVYYAWDTASVFDAVREGIRNRKLKPRRISRGDRSIVERVASRDVSDREAVEAAYLEGDAGKRKALLEAALRHPESAPVGLLRLGVFDVDPELAALARRALAKVTSPAAVDVINEALRGPVAPPEREALIGALERLADKAPRARTLAVVHRGLSVRSRTVDLDGWADSLRGGATYAPVAFETLEAKVERLEREVRARPNDAALLLELAQARLRLAVDPQTTAILRRDRRTAGKFARLLLEDARRAAVRAEESGARGWRLDACLALCAFYLGDRRDAYRRAVRAAPGVPAGAKEWIAISTLALFAEARKEAITQAIRAKREWPGQWLTDVNAAYAVLARHPLGTDRHVAAHYDFLTMLGAHGRAARVLDDGLKRFPLSGELHDCLRQRLLREVGPEGLEAAYERMLSADDAPVGLAWFAGLASIVAAEFHRRARDHDAALAAYDRAMAFFRRAMDEDPGARGSSSHYVALALAGKAHLALERRDLDHAVEWMVQALRERPESAGSVDGLNIAPIQTARRLRAILRMRDRSDLLQRLDAALAELDPDRLRLPAYERRGPGRRPRRGRE